MASIVTPANIAGRVQAMNSVSSSRTGRVADTLDATQALATEEFQLQLKGLLDAARKLALSPREILDRVEQALSDPPHAAQPPTDPTERKPK